MRRWHRKRTLTRVVAGCAFVALFVWQPQSMTQVCLTIGVWEAVKR